MFAASHDKRTKSIANRSVQASNSYSNELGIRAHGNIDSNAVRSPSRRLALAVPHISKQENIFPIDTSLENLVGKYRSSNVAAEIKLAIQEAKTHPPTGSERSPASIMSGSKRIGWFPQFVILSKRTFKNLYRNPMLMFTHYTIAILLARKIGLFLDFADLSVMRLSILQRDKRLARISGPSRPIFLCFSPVRIWNADFVECFRR